MCYGVSHRHVLDLALLWCRLAAAVLTQPLAWEFLHAMGMALKKKKKEEEEEEGLDDTIPRTRST